MKRIWFKVFLGFLAGSVSGMVMFLLPNQAEAYQEASTPTGIFVTVTYTDPINVRGGPSTVYYPIVGQVLPGDILPALGVSPGHEWVQVSYPDAPGGVGWVYATYVSVSGGELRVVEPPPTSTPIATITIDPTLAAAFNFQPTATRMPTFTPPSPLDVPTFEDATESRPSGIALGVLVISLASIGAFGLLVSVVLRKQ
jgi:uncharacterized protein YraI